MRKIFCVFCKASWCNDVDVTYGFYTLPDTGSDPDSGMDIHPKNGFSNEWGSGSRLESKYESMQWEQFL